MVCKAPAHIDSPIAVLKHYRDNFPNGDPEGRNLGDMLKYLRVDCKVKQASVYQRKTMLPKHQNSCCTCF